MCGQYIIKKSFVVMTLSHYVLPCARQQVRSLHKLSILSLRHPRRKVFSGLVQQISELILEGLSDLLSTSKIV